MGAGAATADDAAIASLFEELAARAGRDINAIRAAGFSVRNKPDKSPVTEADLCAERIILDGLAQRLPEFPVVAEEQVAAGHCPEKLGEAFILVDALDGTREFVAKSGEFTVNIALIREGNPVVGVVCAPASRLLFVGWQDRVERLELSEDGAVTGRHRLEGRSPREGIPRVLASRSHDTPETEAYIREIGACEIIRIGSSLKFCLLAEGKGDIYPRMGPTMEWDTAAGDAVLRAAGGMTTDTDGEPLTYGKQNIPGSRDFANPWFIARAANG